MQLLIIAGMLVAASSVIFALQNNVPVTVTFLLWRFDSSLALVLLLALAIGGFIIGLVSTPSTLRRQWRIVRQDKRIAELERTCAERQVTIAKMESRLQAVEPPSEQP
jgi:uncharacterized integral membrane protein